MRKIALILGAILLTVLSFSVTFAEVKLPQPTGYVNDFAQILTPEQVKVLDQRLKDFDTRTSNEITVAIVPSLQGLDRFTYSQQLFTEWGIGKKDKNNGVLFLIGPKDDLPFPEHGDAFINVGKGLEGALPDGMVGSILRHDVFPQFADKKYFEGIQAGVLSIMQATQGEYVVPVEPDDSESADTGGKIIFGFWAAMIALSYLGSFLGRTKSWWLGGVIGGVGGGILGGIFLGVVGIFGAAGFFAAIGFIFDFVVSKNYEKRLKEGKKTDFWSSGGGFWFGGGRGGFGGGGGGGFGGFGGGSSGGGGAGGSW